MKEYINGIQTVNCGTIKNINIGNKEFMVELLSKEYSGHESNICCYYDTVEDVNVEVSVSIQNNHWYFEIYRFKKGSTHSYYSKRYLGVENVPEKYKFMAMIALSGYRKYFSNVK